MKPSCWGKVPVSSEVGAGGELSMPLRWKSLKLQVHVLQEVRACRKNLCVLFLSSASGPRIISIILRGRSLPINLWGASGKGVPLEGPIRITFGMDLLVKPSCLGRAR